MSDKPHILIGHKQIRAYLDPNGEMSNRYWFVRLLPDLKKTSLYHAVSPQPLGMGQ